MTNQINQLVQELVSQGRSDEAYSVLASYVAKNAEDLEAQLQLGRFCYEQGRFGEAERSLKLASQGEQKSDCLYLLGLTLLKLSRPSEAMNAFRENCELSPDFALGYLHWGVALMAMKSFKGALGQFKKALTLSPNLVVAFYQAGMASFNLGEFSEAVEYFQKATKIDSQFIEAFNGLGAAQAALNLWEPAIESYRQSLQLDNSQLAVKRSVASLFMQMGNAEEAAHQYQELLSSTSQNLDARARSLIYNDWGVNLFADGRLEEATDKLFQSTSVDPGFVQAHINLGRVLLALNEYEQATEVFENSLAIEPESVICRLNYGSALFLQGRYEEARDELLLVTSPDVEKNYLQLWLGYCYLALNQFEEAESSFKEALDQVPDEPMSLDALGVALAFQDRYEEATEKFQQCIDLNPEYALAHLHLARSYETAGLFPEAEKEYKLAASKDSGCLISEKETIEYLLKQQRYDLVKNKSTRLVGMMPDDDDAQLSLARALRGKQEYEEALQVLAELLAKKPDCGPALVLEGQIFLSQGALLEADEKFRVASDLYEGDVTLFYSWGKALSLLGMHELALEKFQQANEIDPFDGDTYDSWGSTLKMLGRYQEAADVYKKAAEYI